MAWLFFDTSAISRWYLTDESGAARVRRLCRPSAGHTIVIGQVTRVEVASSLARAYRAGRIDAARRRELWRLFQRHVGLRYVAAELPGEVVDAAADLVLRHPLRAYDAVQIASALRVRSGLDPSTMFRFVTADQTQATAAQAEGLDVDLIP